MKKLAIGCLTVLAALFLCVSCAPSVPSGTNENPSDTTGSISIQLPGTARAVAVSDIDRFSIEITSTPLNYSKTVTGTPGQSVKVDNLAPGSYNVLVNAYDDNLSDANKLVFTGSNGATVTAGTTAAVSIALSPAVGDLSVTVTFPADPSTVTRQRFKGVKDDWQTAFATYDSNGIITKIEYYRCDDTVYPYRYKLYSTTDFQFSDTLTRSGATVKDASGTVTQNATIAHDGSGNETSITFTNIGGTSGYTIAATYNAAGTAIVQLSTTQTGETTPYDIRTFNDNGDLKSVESIYLVYLDEKYTSLSKESPKRAHKVIISYDTTTRIPVQFDHYANGIIVDTEIRTLSPSGFYQKAEHKRTDGSIMTVATYGNPIIIGDYYAQPTTRTYFGDVNDSASGNFETSFSYYQLFTKTFQPAGTTCTMRTYEAGTAKSGIINPLYGNIFTN